VGGARAFSLPFFKGGGTAVGWGSGVLCGGGTTAGGAGMGADTRCDRSRMDAWRSAIPGAVCCSWACGRFASCEEISWSSSLRFSFSSEMVATAWVTPLSSCEMVTRPWTNWERSLFRTQSRVELRLYVKCRGGEEVCEKRGLSLGRNQAPSIGIFSQP